MGLFSWLRRRRSTRHGRATPVALPPLPRRGFAVVDIETTGFSHLKNRIIEIAVVRTDSDGQIVDEWSTLLNPDGPVGATHVHNITSADVRNAPRFADVAGDLADRLAGHALVAHNATFDLAFIRTEFARAGVPMPDVPSLCTLDASHHYLPELNRRRLADCCWAVGVEHDDAHSALGDARATARLLRSYLEGLRRRPDHLELPTRAAVVPWPSVARRTVQVVHRPSIARAITPAPAGALAALLEDLPLAAVLDEWAPAATTAYVELLAEALEDGILTTDEAESLAGLAGAYGLSREQVNSAHRGFLLALAHKAVEDGKVTHAERDELLNVVRILGFADDTVRLVLDVATAEMAAARVLQGAPLPAGWSHGTPLRAGMAVVFTGCDELERARLVARARGAGLRVTGSVSRRTALLITDGSNPNTRKAIAAREHGIRTVSPATFARLVEHVQPAADAVDAVPAVTHLETAGVGARTETLGSVVDLGAVRAWARAHGHPVGVRGRIAQDVLARYRAAHVVAS